LILEKAYAEFARVLKPEGILALLYGTTGHFVCIHYLENVKALKIPWTGLPAFLSPRRGEERFVTIG